MEPVDARAFSPSSNYIHGKILPPLQLPGIFSDKEKLVVCAALAVVSDVS